MSRVKFAAKHEYESLANFKILQNVFKAKKIDKVGHLFRLNRSVHRLLLRHVSFRSILGSSSLAK